MNQRPKYISASIDAKRFSCPHCGAIADQQWFGIHVDKTRQGQPPVLLTRDGLDREIQKQRIPKNEEDRKKHQAVLDEFAKEAAGNVFLKDAYCSPNTLQVIYPNGVFSVEPNADLPDDIKRDFEEARAILELSPRGAAALLRLCIQKLLIHLKVFGDTIDKQIATLVVEGLHPQLQQALDIVRVVGNESVHPGSMDMRDDRPTAAALFDLVNRIAYDRITHPNEVAQLYGSLPQSKRDGIARRDKKP